eukprot:1758680-Rhodomonas_salina.2
MTTSCVTIVIRVGNTPSGTATCHHCRPPAAITAPRSESCTRSVYPPKAAEGDNMPRPTPSVRTKKIGRFPGRRDSYCRRGFSIGPSHVMPEVGQPQCGVDANFVYHLMCTRTPWIPLAHAHFNFRRGRCSAPG